MAMGDDALSDEDAELERQLSMMPTVEAPARTPAHSEAALPRNTVEPSRKLVNRSLGEERDARGRRVDTDDEHQASLIYGQLERPPPDKLGRNSSPELGR